MTIREAEEFCKKNISFWIGLSIGLGILVGVILGFILIICKTV